MTGVGGVGGARELTMGALPLSPAIDLDNNSKAPARVTSTQAILVTKARPFNTIIMSLLSNGDSRLKVTGNKC